MVRRSNSGYNRVATSSSWRAMENSSEVTVCILKKDLSYLSFDSLGQLFQPVLSCVPPSSQKSVAKGASANLATSDD